MGVGQLSESDAVDALRLPFYSSSHPTGSHGWRNQFDLGNPDLMVGLVAIACSSGISEEDSAAVTADLQKARSEVQAAQTQIQELEKQGAGFLESVVKARNCCIATDLRNEIRS